MSPAAFGLDPDCYFVDADRVPPLIVEHATGRPVYAIEHGKLSPYRPTPRPPANGHAATFRAEGGGLSLGIQVTPPGD